VYRLSGVIANACSTSVPSTTEDAHRGSDPDVEMAIRRLAPRGRRTRGRREGVEREDCGFPVGHRPIGWQLSRTHRL